MHFNYFDYDINVIKNGRSIRIIIYDTVTYIVYDTLITPPDVRIRPFEMFYEIIIKALEFEEFYFIKIEKTNNFDSLIVEIKYNSYKDNTIYFDEFIIPVQKKLIMELIDNKLTNLENKLDQLQKSFDYLNNYIYSYSQTYANNESDE